MFTTSCEVCVICVNGVQPDGHIRVGKLNLVDLAGSERQSKTGATGAAHQHTYAAQTPLP